MRMLSAKQSQVSFRSGVEYSGPQYDGDWDGEHRSERRILACADAMLGATR